MRTLYSFPEINAMYEAAVLKAMRWYALADRVEQRGDYSRYWTYIGRAKAAEEVMDRAYHLFMAESNLAEDMGFVA